MFYHLLTKKQFENHYGGPDYGSEILKENAFLHCCTGVQLPKVIEKHYSRESEVFALEVNEESLKADCRYESSSGSNELFPHIYGTINKEAVTRVLSINHDLLVIGDAPEQFLTKIVT